MLVVLAAVIAALLLISVGLSRRSPQKRKRRRDGKRDPFRTDDRFCPICGSDLLPGETLHSIVFEGKSDTIAEVYGCPHCYGKSADAERVCPVCRNRVPSEGFLIGRMFTRPEKTHLHIVGCTECWKRKYNYWSGAKKPQNTKSG